MQSTFFSAMAVALAGTQHRINVAIETAPSDALKVMITADLGPTPEKASETEVKLRTAMCRPLLLVGSALEIEAALLGRLTQHVQALNEGTSLLDEIRSIGASIPEKTKAATPAKSDADDDSAAQEEEEAGEESATASTSAESSDEATTKNLGTAF